MPQKAESGCNYIEVDINIVKSLTIQSAFTLSLKLDPRTRRLPPKSIKLYWNERSVANGDVLRVLFGDRKETIETATTLIHRMKSDQHLAMTKREMRLFAKDLETGKLGVKYSYHNFYVKLLRKLLDMGFVEKDVLVWDDKRKKTQAVYQL